MSRVVRRDVVEVAAREAGIPHDAIHYRATKRGCQTGWSVVTESRRLPLFGACLARAAAREKAVEDPAAFDAIGRLTDEVIAMCASTLVDKAGHRKVEAYFPDWTVTD